MGLRQSDISIVEPKNVGLFYYRQADLSHEPTFVGLFGNGILESLSQEFGALSRVVAPDPARPGQFVQVASRREAPDFGEATINEWVNVHAANMLELVRRQLCDIVLIAKLDNCGRADELAVAGAQYFELLGVKLETLNINNLMAREGTDNAEIVGTLKHEGFDRIAPLRSEEHASAVIVSEVLKVLYVDAGSCGDCSPYASNCQHRFALTIANAGSPGLSSQIVYTVDGATYTTVDITGISGSDMAIVGSYVVVVDETNEVHAYAPLADFDGTTTPTWTQVTGYQTGGGGRAIFSLAPTITFVAGAGGYLYKLDSYHATPTVIHDASLTTQDGNCIDARGQVVLSGHDSNVLLLSTNQGDSFSVLTGPSVGNNITQVHIVSATTFWVTTSAGEVFYTQNGGTSWTQSALPDEANITSVNDIKFSPDFREFGALAVQKAFTSEIYSTFTGGREWLRANPGVIQLDTLPEKYNSVALCGVVEIFAGGLKSAGDGILVVAS